MILTPKRHAIKSKLLSGGASLLLALTCLSAVQPGRAETQSSAKPAQINPGGSEIKADLQAEVRLEPGKSIEQEIAGGKIHYYRVMLRAGDYLQVVVSKHDAGMNVTLLDPDGKPVIEILSHNSKQGVMLRAVAEVDGDYRLRLRPKNERAAAEKYVIKIEELRVATLPDRKQFAADLVFAAAKQLEEKGTAEASREALKKYDESLALLRAIGNHRGEAYTLNSIGLIYKRLGDNHKAIEYYNRALTTLNGEGADWEEPFILNNAAIVYNTLGESQKALEYYSKALALLQANRNGYAEVLILTNMGAVYFVIGESQKALEYYNKALQLRRSLGGLPEHEIVTLTNIGVAYEALGEKQKALEYYNQALSYSLAAGRESPTVLSNIGVILDALGEKQKALEHFNRALKHFRSAGDRRAIAITLSFIGTLYNSLGDSSKALEYYNEALPLIQAAGDRYREALILRSAGDAYDSLGEKQKALDHYTKSLLLGRAVKARYIEVLALYRVALTFYSLNNIVEARSNIEAALEVIESFRAKVASSDLRASYFASVQHCYDFYISLLMRLDQLHPNEGYDAMALEASERARARSLLEMLMEGRVDIHQGVEPALLERERSLKQSLDAKNDRQVRLLSREHTSEQAEQIDGEIKQLLAQYQEVKDQIKLKSPGYAALTQPRPLTLKEIQQGVIDADTLLLEYSLGEQQSYLWAVTQDSMVALRLPKRAEIEEAAQRVYDLLSVDQRKRPSQFNTSYSEAVSALSRIILGPVAPHLKKKRLVIVPQGALSYIPFAALPLPASQEQESANIRQAAYSSPEPLIAKHEIIYLPSASTLAVLRRELEGRKLPAKAVAVIADPVFSKDDVRAREAIKGAAKSVDEKSGRRKDEPRKDEPISPSNNISETALLRSTKEVGLGEGDELPRLPFSRKEAEAIFDLGQQAGAMTALDFNANRETATGAEIRQYRIVHFATHSLLNNEHPELSGLVLSLVDKQGQPQNGFLRLYDIYNLRLGADLVVLSACQTALGKQIKGEGLVGVTRGFMYAGAARVMASLWKVDDQATAELMNRFYVGMMKDKKEPAAALREAQLWMQKQKRWQSPFYWSGFIIQGEWR